MTLSDEDLIIDKIYKGLRNGNASDDPLPSLLNVDSGAGFRHLGKRPEVETLKLIVLKSNFNDQDWPDYLDKENGLLTYYGDNKQPGRELHDTPRKGNQILKNLFSVRHQSCQLNHFPPIFVFGSTGNYRDVRYLGLAVPGAESLGADNDLVAVWRTGGADNNRFQNYKSIFTILDVPRVSRKWIVDIQAGNAVESEHAPSRWKEWLTSRKYRPLLAPRSRETRTKDQQLPSNDKERQIQTFLLNRYKNHPVAFEKCALEITKLLLPKISSSEITRPWRDGGRDAIGTYTIGQEYSRVEVSFALEAKCYSSDKGVGVREVSRLISRLRHRQFGVLVTTSYLASQAYSEIIEDQHPVMIISGGDIARLLLRNFGSSENVRKWLSEIDE